MAALATLNRALGTIGIGRDIAVTHARHKIQPKIARSAKEALQM